MGSDGFDNPLTGGEGQLIYPRIKSPNYIPGVSGWSIERDGSAEFNNIVVRGEVYVQSPTTGSYVRIWNQDPGDGAIIEIRPGDSVGTVSAPAYIGTGTDPIFGDGGLKISGPSINAAGIPAITLNEQGMFLEASQGVFYVTSDAGVVLNSGGDTDFVDLTNAVTVQYRPGSGNLWIQEAEIDYATLTSGVMGSGDSITFNREWDDFYGPGGGAGTTTSASFSNTPGSSAKTVFKEYGSTELELDYFGTVRCTGAGATRVELAIQVDGVDYPVAKYWLEATGHHYMVGGRFRIPSATLGSGLYNWRARWRREGGTGTLVVDDYDKHSAKISEVN